MWTMNLARSWVLAPAVMAAGMALATAAPAQELDKLAETVKQISTHVGEMSMSLTHAEEEIDDNLRFEPYQQLEEMFFRDDVVFLMRHGPTDWSKLDKKAVLPTDCDNQRILSPEGAKNMRDFGSLLASSEVIPSQIVVSEWCRNQQTLQAMFEGFDRVDPEISANMPVETVPGVNLLLSLNGAKNVTVLKDLIDNWNGNPDRKGPLLIITHYTNIEELTQFRVLEGEVLVVDPKRDNQVLGYVRLHSAKPDIGHFAEVVNSPLMAEDDALDMVTRYYDALATGDLGMLDGILSERWVSYGATPADGVQNLGAYMKDLAQLSEGLSYTRFRVDDVHVADEVVTVIGTISGRHTHEIFGIPATDKSVSFGGIAVHRIEEGQIVESWQMSDRLGLLRQLTAE